MYFILFEIGKIKNMKKGGVHTVHGSSHVNSIVVNGRRDKSREMYVCYMFLITKECKICHPMKVDGLLGLK